MQRLSRLVPYLADPEGHAEVTLHFGLDAEDRRLLSGSVTAELHLTCQRCLRSLNWPVSSELAMLVFDTREQLDKLLRLQGISDMEHDVLVLDEVKGEVVGDLAGAPKEGGGAKSATAFEQELDIQALIEDELILSLPLVPLHEDASCSQEWNSLKARTEAEEVQAPPKPSPFAVLAQLKKGGKPE
ncbi:MAG: YceD family protein [Pseudomonadota bacterium]